MSHVRPLLFFVFSLISAIPMAQGFSVAGTVTDAQSGQTLTGASVFCQNTTLGTVTNTEGRFRMQLPDGGYDLVISFNGYETQSLRINAASEGLQSLDVKLKMKDRSLEAVSVVATTELRDGWKRYGDLFSGLFLGMTVNSDSCRIDNRDSLRFFYSKKRDRLKVIAREPLKIVNQALGYVIRYELDSFVHEFASGLTEYTGYALFEEMQGDEAQQQLWAEQRERAYFGSMLHFVRCYYDSTLRLNGYKLERIDPRTEVSALIYNPYDSSRFAVTEEGDVMLLNEGKLRVVYTQERPESKYLQVKKLPSNTPVQISILDFPEYILIEQNGYYYDQKDILVNGYWSWEKLADLLPYDYDPE
jgi:hypothetical protein